MLEVPYILSLGYRKQIEEVCSGLKSIDFQYFVMYIVFNNGNKFVLTNMSHLSIPYYTDEFYKEDFSFNFISPINYYLCDRTISVSERFKSALEERFGVHRAYYIRRSCAECTFVFGAIKHKKFDDYANIYKQTIKKFEEFCVVFVDHFVDLIRAYVPDYKYSFILTSQNLRYKVITGKNVAERCLTERERECLWFASQGRSIKDVAKKLGISPTTVETHNKKIREKLACSTMIEAVVQGIQMGVIGKINYCMSEQDVPNIAGFKIVSSMGVLKNEISKTSLVLLNSV